MNIEAIQTRSPYMYPEMERFFILAIRDKAIGRMRWRRGHDSYEHKEIRWGIVVDYLFSPMTEDEIAQKYGYKTRQNIACLLRPMFRRLYRASSLKLKVVLASLDEIRTGRTISGGVTGKVAEMVTQGADFKQIQRGLGLNTARLREILEKRPFWGVEIPEVAKKEPDASLTSVLTGFGYHFRVDRLVDFIPVLERAGIPLKLDERHFTDKEGVRRIQRFYHLKDSDCEKARQVWGSDKSLERYKRNPVTKIRGRQTAEKIPTTSNLLRKENFNTVGRVLYKTTGINTGTGRPLLEALLGPDCPVDIFKHQKISKKTGKEDNGYYYRTGQKEILAAYLRDRAVKLGLKLKR